MEINQFQLELLRQAVANSRGQHTARGRRRSMERAIDKLVSKHNKSDGDSLEDHED